MVCSGGELHNSRGFAHKLILQRGRLIPFAAQRELMAQTGKRVARQLPGLHTEEAFPLGIAQFLQQTLMQPAERVQIALVIAV